MAVRFLPPHDPFLELRDRETLLPDQTLHRHVWRHAGNPGVVLADGQFIGTWRAEKKGKRLQVTVEQFGSLSANLRSQMGAEAATLAPFEGCTSVEIAFARVVKTPSRDETIKAKTKDHSASVRAGSRRRTKQLR